MQKVILKLYLDANKRPLFECEISDNVEGSINLLDEKLNGNDFIVKFGQVCFKRAAFHHYEIIYK